MHYFQPEGERRRSSTLHDLLMEEFAKTDELLEMQVCHLHFFREICLGRWPRRSTAHRTHYGTSRRPSALESLVASSPRLHLATGLARVARVARVAIFGIPFLGNLAHSLAHALFAQDAFEDLAPIVPSLEPLLAPSPDATRASKRRVSLKAAFSGAAAGLAARHSGAPECM